MKIAYESGGGLFAKNSVIKNVEIDGSGFKRASTSKIPLMSMIREAYAAVWQGMDVSGNEGAGMLADGVEILDCTIHDNALSGVSTFGEVVIKDSKIYNNGLNLYQEGDSAGGVNVLQGSVTITNTEIYKHTSAGTAGILIPPEGSVIVNQGKLYNNNAGVYSNGGDVTINGTEFYGHNDYNFGPITVNAGGSLNIDEANIHDNVVAIYSQVPTTITNSIINNNKSVAVAGDDPPFAIYITDKGSLNISGSQVSNNPGGIYSAGAVVNVNQGKLSNNTAGIYSAGGAITINGTEFLGHNDYNLGPITVLEGGSLNIDGGNIHHNATALYSEVPTTIKGSNISHNYFDSTGQSNNLPIAIYITKKGSLNISNSKMENNFVAIYSYGNVDAYNNVEVGFKDNGIAVNIDGGSSLRLDNNNFFANKMAVTVRPGVGEKDGADINATNNTFTNNEEGILFAYAENSKEPTGSIYNNIFGGGNGTAIRINYGKPDLGAWDGGNTFANATNCNVFNNSFETIGAYGNTWFGGFDTPNIGEWYTDSQGMSQCKPKQGSQVADIVNSEASVTLYSSYDLLPEELKAYLKALLYGPDVPGKTIDLKGPAHNLPLPDGKPLGAPLP